MQQDIMEGENNMETVVKDATNGNNVISSIDMNIQRIVQNAMKKYMKKYGEVSTLSSRGLSIFTYRDCAKSLI